MEIPCKLIFKGPLKELQEVQKYFDNTLGIQVHIQNFNSDAVVCETISVSSSSYATSLDTTIKYPQPEKRALDTVSAECSKEKRIKCVTVDNSKSNIIINTKGVWVQFRHNTLMMEDKYIIENSLRLTDKHISFANCLISRQFPHIGGLRMTILQTRYYCFPSQNIQAVFCKQHEHWIVASNMQTSECSTVNVHDSLFTELDQESSSLILRMFHNRNNDGRQITIVMKKLQRQDGSADCGLFAIAVMTSLAHKEDPSTVTYDQSKMR